MDDGKLKIIAVIMATSVRFDECRSRAKIIVGGGLELTSPSFPLVKFSIIRVSEHISN